MSWLVWLFCMTIGTPVVGNVKATWRIAGAVAQDCGTESPPIELAPPVTADTTAPLPDVDLSAADTRLGSSTAPGCTVGLVSPRWPTRYASVVPAIDELMMATVAARDASPVRLRAPRAPRIVLRIPGGTTWAGAAAAGAAAWATVAAWPASPAGLVVCGGEVNNVNFDAAAEEPA